MLLFVIHALHVRVVQDHTFRGRRPVVATIVRGFSVEEDRTQHVHLVVADGEVVQHQPVVVGRKEWRVLLAPSAAACAVVVDLFQHPCQCARIQVFSFGRWIALVHMLQCGSQHAAMLHVAHGDRYGDHEHCRKEDRNNGNPRAMRREEARILVQLHRLHDEEHDRRQQQETDADGDHGHDADGEQRKEEHEEVEHVREADAAQDELEQSRTRITARRPQQHGGVEHGNDVEGRVREVAEDAIAFAEELGELTIVHPEAQQWEHQRDEHRDHDAHPLALGATPLHQCHDPTEEEEQERDHHDHEEHHPYVPLEVDAHAERLYDLHEEVQA